MKKLLLFLGIAVMLGGLVSCEEKGENDFPEPVKISFEEYSLEGTSCQWKNIESGKVIVINSNEELENYLDCTEEDGYHEIDFSKYSLLLACGGAPNGVGGIDAVFFQNSINRYTLKITVHLGITMVAEPWNKGILVPKISNKSIVTLEIQNTYN